MSDVRLHSSTSSPAVGGGAGGALARVGVAAHRALADRDYRGYRLLLLLYVPSVTTVFAALVARELYAVPLRTALAWQGAVYFSWAAVYVALRAVTPRAAALGGLRRATRIRLLAGPPLVLGHALLTAWITRRVRHDAGAAELGSLGDSLLERVPVDLLIYVVLLVTISAGELWMMYRERQRAAAALQHQATRAHLHALQLQIRPHFLFNTLQAIATLIPRAPESAVHMTLRLSELLRRTLHPPREQAVPLAEELDMARAYLEIEQFRFGDRLRVRWEVAPEAARCTVPDFLLQPLVENAIRHGIEPRRSGGEVAIAARVDGTRLVLCVEDDGVGMPAAGVGREGVGLSTTRERLRTLYGAAHDFRMERRAPRGTRVTIQLPAGEPGVPAPQRPRQAAPEAAGVHA
ncbi:MAG: sensor histidine kinase [Gemmatimonadaceae bacterium]